jgi:hypothetical protein
LADESLATAVVPSSNRLPVKLPRKRKTAFREHLARIVAESVRLDPDATARPLPDEEAHGAPQFDTESPAVRTGCATCRGHCCHFGAGKHAFLDVDTVRRYRTSRPRLRPRAIVTAYMRRIPEMSIEDSCVFHGASGCTLAREMRASICNTFHCEGLHGIERAAAEPGVRAILIVAASDASISRSAVHDCAAKFTLPTQASLTTIDAGGQTHGDAGL